MRVQSGAGQWVKRAWPRSIHATRQRRRAHRPCRCERGPWRAPSRARPWQGSQVAVDENPVESQVDEGCGDECEGNGADPADALEIAAESAIDEQGEGAPVEQADVGAGEEGDGGVDAAAGEDPLGGEHEAHEQRGEGEGDVDGLGEGAVAVVEAAGAPGLRDEGVEAEEKADAEEGGRVVDGVAESDGADGVRSETADHDEVDDGHGHPAELGEDDGNGEGEESAEFFTDARGVLVLLEELDGGGRDLKDRDFRRQDFVRRSFGVLHLTF